jgi:hypothetical protein
MHVVSPYNVLLQTITNPLTRSIHDLSAIQAHRSTQEPSSDTSDSPGSSTQPSSQSHSEDRERNIVPVTWRVIGGGVMMGGQSTYTLPVFILRTLI